MRKFLVPLLAVLLACGLAGCATAPTISSDKAEAAGKATTIGFYDDERLREHYSKHGYEFGSISKDEYLKRAIALRDAPVGNDVLQIIRGDTVRTRFDRKSGAFLAFEQDLTILTFFRPSDGERYFYRQATRPH